MSPLKYNFFSFFCGSVYFTFNYLNKLNDIINGLTIEKSLINKKKAYLVFLPFFHILTTINSLGIQVPDFYTLSHRVK